MGGSPARVRKIQECIADAIATVSHQMRDYIKVHPKFKEIGSRMLQQWELGISTSLKVS
jgi:hypothetical protein